MPSMDRYSALAGASLLVLSALLNSAAHASPKSTGHQERKASVASDRTAKARPARPHALPSNPGLQGFERFALAAAGGQRAFLAEVIEQVRANPARRQQVLETARRFELSNRIDIDRAADVGSLLAVETRTRGLPMASLAVTPAGAGVSVSGQQNSQQARSAAVFATWGYLPTRTFPANASSDYGWAYNRVELNSGFSEAARREFGANWGNAAVGQSVALNLQGPNGLQGWTGRGVTVAVIDGGMDARFATNNPLDGFAYVHPEFAGRLDIRSRRIFANGNWDLDIQDTPGSHGVHVAGTIGAAWNGVGMVGVAPGTNILALKAIGPNAGDPVQSMAYAGSLPDVRIINGSYGPSAVAGETTWTTGDLGNEFLAVRQALANGKVLVFATGNDYAKAPVQAANPTGIPLFPFINPRNASHGAYNDGGRNYDFSILNRLPGFIVAVANLDHNFQISADSNHCGVAAAWCVSAPGGGQNGGTNAGILSTAVRGLQNISDPGQGSNPAFGPDSNLGYAYLNGTSMATPHVSGVIAVLMEAYPSYTPRDIIRLLFATAEDLGAPGVDRIFGHGLVRLDRALLAGPNIANIPGDFVPNLAPGQQTVWGAPIFTDRGLVVQGSRSAAGSRPDGDLVIAGVAEFRGGVDVASGELVVEGTLKAPKVTVGSDAWLWGDGVIQGNLHVNGTLMPGYGPGSLNIFGNVTLNPGARFHVDIDGYSDEGGPGSYSYLAISGAGATFTAGGTAVAAFRGQFEGADNTFTPRIGDRFQIVQAYDGARVVGRFSKLETQADDTGNTGLAPHTRLSLIYQPTSITLAVNPQSFGDLRAFGIALNRRQANVGRALDTMEDRATSAIFGPAADLYDRFTGLGPDRIAPALEQLSGSGHAGVLRSAFADTWKMSGLIGDRMNDLRMGAAPASGGLSATFSRDGVFAGSGMQALAGSGAGSASQAAMSSSLSLWGRAFGQASRRSGDGGPTALRAGGGGVVVGGDVLLQPGLTIGAAFGYGRSQVTSTGLQATADSYLASLYASYTRGGFELDLQSGFAQADLRTSRMIDIGGQQSNAQSNSRGRGFFGDAEAGYRFRFTQDSQVWAKPFAGLFYSELGRGAFTETGAGVLGLAFPDQRFGVLRSRLGLAVGTSVAGADGMSFHGDVRAAWGRDLSDDTGSYRAVLAGQPMKLTAPAQGRDSLLAGGRLTAAFGDRLALHVGYAGEFRSRYVSHRLDGGLRYSW